MPPPASRDAALLEARGLACFRGDRWLFRDLDLAVAPGTVVQVQGPNGSGKTSLLRMLCGLTPPAAGEVWWRGRRVVPGPRSHVSELRYLGHADGSKLDLSARENCRFAAALAGGDGRGPDAGTALADVGLTGFEDEPLRTLSAGQRRRAAIARLLLSPAPLWVLDEPFTALDAEGIEQLYRRLERHVAAAGAVVLTSHHPVERRFEHHVGVELAR